LLSSAIKKRSPLYRGPRLHENFNSTYKKYGIYSIEGK
jgi:hypothetical protein